MSEAAAALDGATVLVPAARVRAREVGGEAVLVDLAAGVYFGLNATGALIWRGIAAGATLGETHAAVVDAFEVEADTAWGDLVALAQDLLAHGLVAVSRTGAAADAG